MSVPSGDAGRPWWTLAWIPHRIGEGAIGPLIPVYAATFAGASAASIGVMEALFSGFGVLGAMAWGRSSDQFGKRKAFIVAGFLGAGLAVAGMFLAEAFWQVFAWRAVQGFSIASYVAVGGALLAEEGPPEGLAGRLGLLHTVSGVAYVLGLVAGAFLVVTRAPRDLFGLAAALSLLSVAAAAWLIDEPRSTLSLGEIGGVLRNTATPFVMPIQRRVFDPAAILSRPTRRELTEVETRAWVYLGAVALAFTGTTSGLVLFPLYLVDLGLTPSVVVLLFLVNATVAALAYHPAASLADRFGYRPVQLGAYGARSAMYLVLALPLFLGLPVGPVLLAGLFLGTAGASWALVEVTGPTALLRSMRIRAPGELMGLYTAALGVGNLAGALLGGLVAEWLGFPVLFLVAAGLVATALATMAIVVYPADGSPAPPTGPGRETA